MKLFKNRFDKNYLSSLKKELSLNQLIKTSFHIKHPREKDGKTFEKCCRIDFMGLSATSLLDIGCNYIPDNTIPLQFMEVMNNVDKFNDKGIFLKIRFLFAYPFSTSFLSLVQAETTTQRSSTEEPAFLRDFRTIAEVDEDTFSSSTTTQNLKNSLEHLQQLIDSPKWFNQTANTVRIRFTPADVNVCMLLVNDSLYYDPYLYSKTNRMHKSLTLNSPVALLAREKDDETIQYFEDHFRYIWDLDTTLVCDDATFYIPGTPNTLKKLRKPDQVTYEKKADRIKKQRFEQSHVERTDDEIRGWEFKVHHLLKHYTSTTKPVPSIETVFIACSWHEGKDGRSSPNEYARTLAEWLDYDFGRKLPNPYLLTQILVAPAGGSLTNEIYPHLRDATMGIVILTSDIKSDKGQHYSKPNIYHELGFLMCQIESSRLLVLKEDGAHVPTNISDVVHVDFAAEKLALSYREIIGWVQKNCHLIKNDLIVNAYNSHSARLNEMVIDGSLKQVQAKEAVSKIKSDLANLKSTKL